MDVITTHINADFDAVASMIAAKKFYPSARLVLPGSSEKSVRDFLRSSPVIFDFHKITDIDLQSVTRLILVDARNKGRIGKFSGILDKKGLSIHIYDTHPPSHGDIKGQKMVIEQVGAATTIFTEMLQQQNIDISPVEATVLALGIYEETGSLVFSSTTVRDITAAAYLLKKGANLNVVATFVSRELEPEEIDLLNELVQSAREYLINGIRVKIAKASRDHYIGDIAYLAHKLRDIEDIDVLFLLVMMEDTIYMIGRSRAAEADLSEILNVFNGGGHPAAASAVVRNTSLEETEEKLTAVLKKKIKPLKTAKDIMTSPIKNIGWEDTIKNAEKILTRYGVNVLPAVKEDSYYGLISREVVEKALFHGFGRSKVSKFCSTDALTVAPETSMQEVESLMIEQNQRFMPVISDGQIIGAITRTDLLRSLYEDLLRKSRITEERVTGKPIGRNVGSLMREKFPNKIFEVLKLIGKVASDLNFQAYLVGGSVRDLLRGEANLDIDIVIEGDGISFAQTLGARIHAKVRVHQRFGTAVIITDLLKFDVATARTEYYESPGALPKVETSSIKKDLYRRDFTINALAIRLNSEHFGQLLDFFGGLRDLREKNIRILHNLSFIEDPTRAFRAIRFSERFGFKISKHTRNLIKTAEKINLFTRLSGSRLYDELNLLFIETEPLKAINRLDSFDLLKFIHPNLKITDSLKESFKAIQETISWFRLQFLEGEFNESHLYLMALLEDLKSSEREKALKRLSVPSRAKNEIMGGIEQSKKVLLKLHGALENNKIIYYAFKPLSLPVILFTLAKAKNKRHKKAISQYLATLRKIEPEHSGADLKKMGYSPGPVFNEILRTVLDARLEGKVKSREEEKKLIKKNFPINKES
jgi:tRNA nucleotidyltransferase (CCA-adding enzyme)